MAAAMQSQVLPGDPHPLEVPRRRQHPLDQPAVLILDPRPLDQRGPRFGDAIRETIANHLELAQIQDAGDSGDRIDPVRYLGVAECLSEEPAKLGLEPGDLAAQLEPCLALVDRDARSMKHLIE